MAFTDIQKMKIVTYLGWPAKTLIESSTHYNTLITDRLENLTPEAEKLAKDYLVRIDETEDKLSGSINRAGIKRVGDIEFFGTQMDHLRGERRRLLRELAELLSIPFIKKGGTMVGVCN